MLVKGATEVETLKQTSDILGEENAFQNAIFKMMPILFRLQSVGSWTFISVHQRDTTASKG